MNIYYAATAAMTDLIWAAIPGDFAPRILPRRSNQPKNTLGATR